MSGEYWPQWHESGQPSTVTVIEEAPLAHPPGFVKLQERPEPQKPNNCRIKRVVFK